MADEFKHFDLKARTVMWALGIVTALMVGLIGVIYSGIKEEVSTKADKETVLIIQQTTDKKLDRIEVGVSHLEQLYIKHLEQMAVMNSTLTKRK
jgi:hypothetical protein